VREPLHELVSRLDPESAFVAQASGSKTSPRGCSRAAARRRRRHEPEATARLRLFLDVLDEIPERKTALRALVSRRSRTSTGALFTIPGCPASTGSSRGGRPHREEHAARATVENDAARCCSASSQHAGGEVVRRLEPELLHRLFATLAVDALAPAWSAMRDAAVLLSVRIAAAGTDDELRERSRGRYTTLRS